MDDPISIPGVSEQVLLERFRLIQNNPGASLDDMFSSVMGAKATFVQTAPMTLAELMANYPANTERVGLYARVTDLYGSVDDIMRCRFDGVAYRWVPQRESFAGTTAASGGTISLVPLVTPPTLRLTTGSLVSNLTVLPSSTNAYIGQRQRVIMPPALALGLYTASITGLIGSNISLLAGNTKDIEFGPTGWFQSA